VRFEVRRKRSIRVNLSLKNAYQICILVVRVQAGFVTLVCRLVGIRFWCAAFSRNFQKDIGQLKKIVFIWGLTEINKNCHQWTTD
jgi:hypothetical protein